MLGKPLFLFVKTPKKQEYRGKGKLVNLLKSRFLILCKYIQQFIKLTAIQTHFTCHTWRTQTIFMCIKQNLCIKEAARMTDDNKLKDSSFCTGQLV